MPKPMRKSLRKRRKTSRKIPKTFPRRGHDHRSCVAAAVESAASLCERRNRELTPLRRRVLELVWRSHKPVGAYAILSSLRRRGKAAAPPTVYRALDFLLEQGFVHRIASQSAFIGCAEPGSCHAGQFLICTKCGNAAEVNDAKIETAVTRRARRLGFAVERQTVEIAGLCPRCRRRTRNRARQRTRRRTPVRKPGRKQLKTGSRRRG